MAVGGNKRQTRGGEMGAAQGGGGVHAQQDGHDLHPGLQITLQLANRQNPKRARSLTPWRCSS